MSINANEPLSLRAANPKCRLSLWFFLIVFYILCSTVNTFAESERFQASGPLNIRNEMPLYLFFISPTPQSAKALSKGKVKVDASYHVSNVIIQQRPWPAVQFISSDGDTSGQKNREWYVYIDTEVSRFDFNLSYGILDGLELSADVPYFIFSGGYLDGFIEEFEAAFSFIKTPNARVERPRYGYEYEFRNRGKPIIEDYSKPDGLGEISVYLKWQALKEEGLYPSASLRAGVKLPTASNDLLGSDKYDYALSLLLDKRVFDRLSLYFNISYIKIGQPDITGALYGFDNNMWHGVAGFEFFFTNKTSMIFQAVANTTVYDYSGMSPNGGVTSVCKDPVVLTLGFNHNFNDKISWQVAMNENTNSAAPDFGLFTGLKIKV